MSPAPAPPPLPTIPDMELILGDTLRNHSDLTALGNTKVGGRLPDTKDFTTPWIRVTQLHAMNAPNAPVDRLIAYQMQLDCYAGSDPHTGQAVASNVGRAARAVIQDLMGKTIQGAVIAQVTFPMHYRAPDLDFKPPRDRVILMAQVYAHNA